MDKLYWIKKNMNNPGKLEIAWEVNIIWQGLNNEWNLPAQKVVKVQEQTRYNLQITKPKTWDIQP